ncbi:Guanine nucleotide-binding protein subunit beta-like protein [Madurella mycetomatis]|uniref:Guanine nucleotide-binding protein subunit beta-like protein n=1 Tax=Madurella mycetomatis TaxID=100816 RepID=A0A175W0Y1_9PEZI|nr:Guanine nucleotide-binding protein subunit beta-like protein [Madurella mycetomatis]
MSGSPPPSFIQAIEEGLTVPPDQRSVASSSGNRSARRWDDPPEEEPGAGGPEENVTTMVFVKRLSFRNHFESEITQLTFTPTETHVVALAPKVANARSSHPWGPSNLTMWSAANGARLPMPTASSYGVRVTRGFAFKPGGAELVVACPFLRDGGGGGSGGDWSSLDAALGPVPRLEIYDLRRRTRLLKADPPVTAPVAWSPDGSTLAGVSARDPSRVMLVSVAPGPGAGRIGTVLMGHMDAVTQLAFLPPVAWSAWAGAALVTAGRDGYVRVTSVDSGRTLHKIEIGARAPANILRVSPDGRLVVTVWGRDVVLWHLDTGRVHNYNLNAVRQTEGWPLCVSPDCRYLACRTEDGFDVSDVLTGKFRGEFARVGAPITAAAFDRDGSRLVVGDYTGELQVFEVVTA